MNYNEVVKTFIDKLKLEPHEVYNNFTETMDLVGYERTYRGKSKFSGLITVTELANSSPVYYVHVREIEYNNLVLKLITHDSEIFSNMLQYINDKYLDLY